MADHGLVRANPWADLRRFTCARIALGRVGSSMPTEELLRFGLAQAQARDAVHLPLDVTQLIADLQGEGFEVLQAHSAAADRAGYLLRPDFGRRLDQDSTDLLSNHASRNPLVFVVADGLSPLAVQRHAVPLLRAACPLLDGWRVGPVVVVEQGRVAIGDAVGELLRAEIVVVLIGERPGLSSPDSLGLYLTYAPRTGRSDAERNCISNIRPEGLPYVQAAHKLAWLLNAARRLGLSGVGLKDESAAAMLDYPLSPLSPIASGIVPE
jgi:ethanolamine ammonia-lyase small subunit